MADNADNTPQETTPIRPEYECDKHDEANGATTPGIGVFVSSLFLFGGMTGATLMALPKAVELAGMAGIGLLLGFWALTTYTGVKLASSWTLTRARYPQYAGHVRNPFSVMGEITYGRVGRLTIAVALFLNLYSAFIVMLLAITVNLGEILVTACCDVPFVYCLLAVAMVLLPIMWFGSPKDFWPVAIGASLTTVLAAICICVNVAGDAATIKTRVTHSTPSPTSVFMSIGMMLYAFSYHPVFPTVQTDMTKPAQFPYAVVIAHTGAAVLFLMVSVPGYFVYGRSLTDSIVSTMSPGPLATTAQVLLTAHFLWGLVISINPVSQAIENTINIPTEFNWKRCVVRTVILASAVCIVLLIPSFGALMSLAGGSVGTLLAVICPVVFYHKMALTEGDWEKIHVSLPQKIIHWAVVLLGITLIVVCTYSSVYLIWSEDLISTTYNSTIHKAIPS